MSQYSDLLSRGTRLLMAKSSPVSITHAGVTKQGLSTPIGKSKELREAGYWPHFHCIVEMFRCDFLTLKIKDRTAVLYTDASANRKLTLKVIGIDGEEDDGDPCVRVTLKEEPAGT